MIVFWLSLIDTARSKGTIGDSSMDLGRLGKGLFVFLGFCAATGCKDERGPVPEVAPLERDSAGIHIVESLWSEPGNGISHFVDGPPSVRIGQVDGPPAYLLSRVGSALRLEDGRILIVDGRTELRVFDSGGEHLFTAGGSGDGPGEFRSIRGLVFARDTLFVFDAVANRMTFLGPHGDFLGDVRFSGEFHSLLGSRSELIAVGPDGRFVFRPFGSTVPRRDPVELFWSTSPLLSVTRDGQTADTLTVIGMDWLTGHQQVMVPPFGRWTSVVANGDRLVMTHGDRFELEVRSISTGELERLFRVRRDPPPLKPSVWRTAVEEALEREARAQGGRSRSPEALAELTDQIKPLTNIPVPYATKPAWRGLFLDAGGRIWAEEASPSDDSHRVFSVFSADGYLIGRATTPMGIRIVQVGRDYLLAVRRDELDIEYVELLEIRSR